MKKYSEIYLTNGTIDCDVIPNVYRPTITSQTNMINLSFIRLPTSSSKHTKSLL